MTLYKERTVNLLNMLLQTAKESREGNSYGGFISIEVYANRAKVHCNDKVFFKLFNEYAVNLWDTETGDDYYRLSHTEGDVEFFALITVEEIERSNERFPEQYEYIKEAVRLCHQL